MENSTLQADQNVDHKSGHQITIIVEVNGKRHPIQFDLSPVTGKAIREKASAPLSDDLVRLVHNKPTGGNIGLDDKIEIRNGDQFLALPTGTVSYVDASGTIERIVGELTSVYRDHVHQSREGILTLLRIDDLELYPTCRPPTTSMLLVLDPNQAKPLVYVRPGQLLANGRVPKSTSTVLVGGESWMQFSFNIPWSEGDSIIRFIAAARQRFTQNE